MVRRFTILVGALMALALAALTPAQAGVRIKVDLNSQTMQVTTPDGDVRNWPISSGRTGFKTIRGQFKPYALKTYHWSRKYGGHMPHAIFFKGGFAIHGTTDLKRLGRPASHGCIRLHPAHARELFQMVKAHGQGSTRIAINGVAPDTGRTMVASAKKRQPVVAAAKRQNAPAAVARARAPQFELIAPAYAPRYYPAPAYFPFQRLR
jgi:hypothetical protein